MDSKPAVTVLILNWNGKKLLEDFLPSVVGSTYSNFKVLLVDNNSSDESVSFVKEKYPNIQLLVLDENYGFTVGNNKAVPLIDTPYFVLLNSDVEVSPDWLQPLVDTMERNPKCASVQPKIRSWREKTHFEYAGASGGFMDLFGYPFCRGRVFDTLEEDEGQYQLETEVFWATGACSMIRTSVVKEIGLFEGALFAHQEEIDFCWRARNAGYSIFVNPLSFVYHVGGATLSAQNPKKTFLNVRNSLSIMFLNLPVFKRGIILFIRLLLDGVWGLKLLLGGDFKNLLAIIKGHWAFFSWIPFLHNRRQERNKNITPSFPLRGVYKGSIVWSYFAKGKKKFSDYEF